MKKELFIYKGLIAAIAIIGAVTLQSCLDDDDNDYRYVEYPNALVTVKTNVDKTFYLQLDEKTTLLPVNVSTSPFGGKEVRALVSYDKVDQASGIYNQAIHINWIDSILTKAIAPDLGEENDAVYGTDPVEIVRDWVTIAEDGYLTLRFRTIWGGFQKPHFINLLPGNNPENPYELEFRHNAYGDVDGYNDDALVAFNLKSLPDTDGKTVKLKLKWQSFSGEKSVEFDYCTQKTVMPHNESITSVKSNKGIR